MVVVLGVVVLGLSVVRGSNRGGGLVVCGDGWGAEFKPDRTRERELVRRPHRPPTDCWLDAPGGRSVAVIQKRENIYAY